MALKAYAFLFREFFVSRANGEPPLYCGLIESDSSLSLVTPDLPILSFPKALPCVLIWFAIVYEMLRNKFKNYNSITH